MGQMVGAVMSMAGGLKTWNDNKALGKIQEKLAERNAQVDEMKAQDAIDRGGQTEFKLRTQTRRLIGAQRAAFGASGIDVNEVDGVATNVVADTAKLSEMDAVTIRTNAAREAWGFKVQAQDDRYQGQLQHWESDQRAIGGLLSMGQNMYAMNNGMGGKK